MINLTGKSVFVKTQEEYLSVLKMAKFQGFTWTRGNHLNPIKIPFPNILNFYDDKNVTCRDFEKTLYGRDLIEETDSVSTASGIKTAKTNSKKRGRDNAVTTKSKSSSSSKLKSSAGKSQSVSKREAAAPKASVRRQRR